MADPLTSAIAGDTRAPLAFQRVIGRLQQQRQALIALGIFLGFVAFYGVGLYPGVGGQINGGDSAKFQVLAHAPIMVHGPGYPLYLMLAAVVRALDLDLAGWWQISFALSAVPGALANAFAFLILERTTGSLRFALAGALLLGSASLMALQATEAEVYALNIAFVLAVTYLLLRFVESERLFFFLAACAVYALSFGNHLMMVMLLPLFVALTVVHYRTVLQVRPIAIIAGFVLLGASQYLYLAYLAYSPDTAYSEYMPLPPSAGELIRYIMGTYFGDLYGSGLKSPNTLEALGGTFTTAHPWLSVPLLAFGLAAFLHGTCRRSGPAWRKVALLYAVGLCFLPFVIWYGPGDIEAFHLPVLAPLLLASVASLGSAFNQRPHARRALGMGLILVGLVRMAAVGSELTDREPVLADTVPQIKATLAELAEMPTEETRPIIAMGYSARMAALYHGFAGELPPGPAYRLAWRVPRDIGGRPAVFGAVLPKSALYFVRKVQESRPDLVCTIRPSARSAESQLQAYLFHCGKRS